MTSRLRAQGAESSNLYFLLEGSVAVADQAISAKPRYVLRNHTRVYYDDQGHEIATVAWKGCFGQWVLMAHTALVHSPLYVRALFSLWHVRAL
jgi:hypothetical protein